MEKWKRDISINVVGLVQTEKRGCRNDAATPCQIH